MAATAAIPSVGAAARDILLPSEGDAAVPSPSAADMEQGLIDESHASGHRIPRRAGAPNGHEGGGASMRPRLRR